MKKVLITRRRFINTAALAAVGTTFPVTRKLPGTGYWDDIPQHVVSIVRVTAGNIRKAVEEAVDLLGGINTVAKGKNSILLKPNLVGPDTRSTTRLEVVKSVARLIKSSGRNVFIGEGSAAAESFNIIKNDTYRTKDKDILDRMQKYVFDRLGFSEMADSLKIPLINLHSGSMTDIPLRNGLVSDFVRINKTLDDVDLVCSVPMMKTHVLAGVTLAMKNFIGCYPGTEYYSVRSWLHDRAAEKGSEGIAYEILDMNRALKTGFSVIDASSAMEGDGPSSGNLIDLGLIIAGTSPLATDMVGAIVMGFDPDTIPQVIAAHKSGMTPVTIEDIEIRGLRPEQCMRQFVKPQMYRWTDINKSWGVKEI